MSLLSALLERSGLRWKQRRQLLDEFMARPQQEWLKATKAAHGRNHAETGVFSFAGDPRSIVMWGHYGDQHAGVCLQFEVVRDPETFLKAIPVQYVRDYPVFNWAANAEEQLRSTLLHKFVDWKYENESRIFWPGGANTYLKFNPAALVGLIVGCRAGSKAIDLVHMLLAERRACGLPEILTYRAERHGKRYALVLRKGLVS